MVQGNRRKFKRLRIDRSVKIPIQVFPAIPFIGEASEAILNNISAGGMAILLKEQKGKKGFIRGAKIKVHFRLPGRPLQECFADITHVFPGKNGFQFVGVRFSKLPSGIAQELNQMAQDNENCDRRIEEDSSPWCVPTCSYYSLCRKPLKPTDDDRDSSELMEIAFETRV